MTATRRLIKANATTKTRKHEDVHEEESAGLSRA
jgi:hypothetical protein